MKRWAEQGLLPSSRTPGGHRRFAHADVAALVRRQAVAKNGEDPLLASWTRCLVTGRRHEVDSQLLEARSRLGAWYRVADEIGLVLTDIGDEWSAGRLCIGDEHRASESLRRGLGRIADMLPTGIEQPRCVLACAGGEEHTLGLSMADLCLRELGWSPLWLGGKTPVSEIIRLLGQERVAMVALSASLSGTLDASRDAELERVADEVAAACRQQGADLVLGGAGPWPRSPGHGMRVDSFREFHAYLTGKHQGAS